MLPYAPVSLTERLRHQLHGCTCQGAAVPLRFKARLCLLLAVRSLRLSVPIGSTRGALRGLNERRRLRDAENGVGPEEAQNASGYLTVMEILSGILGGARPHGTVESSSRLGTTCSVLLLQETQNKTLPFVPVGAQPEAWSSTPTPDRRAPSSAVTTRPLDVSQFWLLPPSGAVGKQGFETEDFG